MKVPIYLCLIIFFISCNHNSKENVRFSNDEMLIYGVIEDDSITDLINIIGLMNNGDTLSLISDTEKNAWMTIRDTLKHIIYKYSGDLIRHVNGNVTFVPERSLSMGICKSIRWGKNYLVIGIDSLLIHDFIDQAIVIHTYFNNSDTIIRVDEKLNEYILSEIADTMHGIQDRINVKIPYKSDNLEFTVDFDLNYYTTGIFINENTYLDSISFEISNDSILIENFYKAPYSELNNVKVLKVLK